jgi:multidrug efflux pump subunit AcrA (membrane-fusion protein)
MSTQIPSGPATFGEPSAEAGHGPEIPLGRPPEGGESAESASPASHGSEGHIEPQLIEETKQQIRALVQEITQLAQSDIPTGDFHEGFLNRVVAALAAVGGAVWTVGDDDSVELEYQVNLAHTGLLASKESQQRHAAMLRKMAAGGKPMLVAPQSGPADEETGNPTNLMLIVGILRDDQRVRGLIEIFQRPGSGPATQRGYLRFLVQMCDLASGYLQGRRLRQFAERQGLWDQLERFLRQIHTRLDVRETAYTVANEGRRIMQCDRVSVAVRRGRAPRIEAVSGVDTLDPRASTVRLLNRLVQAVAAMGESLWYTGETRDLPPQIESALHEYVDESHARLVAVLPLYAPADAPADAAADVPAETAARGSRKERRPPIGALVVEQLSESRAGDAFTHRVETVARHSATAVANALEHESVFLMPLWRTLGRASWLVQARQLPRVVTVFIAVLAVVVGLAVIPADFELHGRGTLEPRLKRDIFAGIDGVVVEVPVEHGQEVEAGQVLARLRNTDLEVGIAALLGQRTKTTEQILAIQRAMLEAGRLSVEEQNRLAGQLLELKKTSESIEQQIALYRQKEEQLVVASPIDGQVVTWQVRQNLHQRPVMQGQVLMTVVDPSSRWELEIQMPEKRMGHVARAYAASQKAGEKLKVTFMLATHPGREFTGHVTQIHALADIQPEQGSCVLIRAALDEAELPDLRPGATVTAKVHCGRRSIGYVLFHDVIAFVESKVLFWLL